MMIELLNDMRPTFVSLLIALVTIWLGYRLGLLTYFQKKEHEQIIKRYLEQGVDLISSNLDHALSTFNENWALSLQILKEFRETNLVNVPMRKESLEKEFLQYDIKAFSVSPYYKIKSLLGDDVFWESAQLVFSFVGNTYSFFENDLKLAIQAFYKPNVSTASFDKIYDAYSEKVETLMKDSYKYYKVVMELQNIAVALETEFLTFNKLISFKNSPLSKTIVNRLRSELFEKNNEES